MRSFKKIKSDLGNGSYYVTCANADGVPHANTEDADKSRESTDSSGTFYWDDFDPDAGAIQIDLGKVSWYSWVFQTIKYLSLLLKF